MQTNTRWAVSDDNRLVPVADPVQRLHKQDFLRLVERARRGRPRSHKSRSPQSREGSSLAEEPEVSEVVDTIEVD